MPKAAMKTDSAPPCTLPTAPANFLNVSSTNKSIKGTYILAGSVPPPSSVLPPKDANGHPLDMRLDTANGSIDAVVKIQGSSDGNPARLEFTTTNGKIKACIEREGLRRFRLRAASTNGPITLRIPRKFYGSISIKRTNSRLVFSPDMQTLITTFSVDGGKSKYFVGGYRESDDVDDERWTDSVSIEALNGRIEISCAPEKGPMSFLKRLSNLFLF